LQARKHVRRDRILTLVVAETQRQVGFHGIQSLILKGIGANLVV
jgi:hypothetical protein